MEPIVKFFPGMLNASIFLDSGPDWGSADRPVAIRPRLKLDFNSKSIIDAIEIMKHSENSKEVKNKEINPKIENEDQIIYTNTSFVFGEI